MCVTECVSPKPKDSKFINRKLDKKMIDKKKTINKVIVFI